MVHQYQLNGYNIVLDVCSGSVHVVDEPSEIRKYMKKGVYGFYTDYWSPRALEELRESGD